MPKTEYVLKFFGQESVVVDVLRKVLSQRKFNFCYQLCDCPQKFEIKNLELATEPLNPIFMEQRGKMYCLVIATNGQEEDPFISVPRDGSITIDFKKIDRGLIKIATSQGDIYEINVCFV